MSNFKGEADGMELYSLLARYYDDIFPLDPAVVGFVRSACPPGMLLDVGCATGALAASLACAGYGVTGIDADPAMICLSRARADRLGPVCGRLDFLETGMLSLDAYAPAGSFDAVTCLGNTLVHLPDADSVTRFLEQTLTLLSGTGVLLVQILNYRFILDTPGGRLLPDIDTGAFIFRRAYRDRPDGRLDFSVTLREKASGVEYSDALPLLPLPPEELDRLLAAAGFTERSSFGGFDRRRFDPDALVLVMEARPGRG
jgi:glycine/sarcosine N-methyltransferase